MGISHAGNELQPVCQILHRHKTVWFYAHSLWVKVTNMGLKNLPLGAKNCELLKQLIVLLVTGMNETFLLLMLNSLTENHKNYYALP